jgi:hypothetical protein
VTEQTLITANEAKARPVVLYTRLEQYAPARELMEAAQVLLSKAAKFEVILKSDADAALASEFRARLNQTHKDLDAARLKSHEEHRKLVEAMNLQAAQILAPMKALQDKVDVQLKAYLQSQADEHAARVKAQKDEAERVQREKDEAERKAREANAAAQQAAADAEAARLAAAAATSEAERVAAQEALAAATATQEAAITTAAQEATKAVQLDQRQETLAALPVESAPTKSIRGTYGSSTGLRDNWKYRLIVTPTQTAEQSARLVPEEYLVAPEDRLDSKMLNAKAKSLKKATSTAVPGIEFYNDPVSASRAGR